MKRLLLLVLVGCVPLQERTSYPLELAATLPSVPNDKGWSVVLDEARMNVGPVRFYEGRVLVSRWSPLELLVRTAHAHPGHYVPGESMGEWLGTATVDLLAGPTRLGIAQAVTGEVGSMQLALPPGDDGHSLVVRGVATRDEETIPFEAFLALDAPLEGVRAEGEVTPEPTVARITIDLAKWLHRVDFATTEDDDADGTFTFGPTTQAFNALSRAVADTGAITVVFAPSEVTP